MERSIEILAARTIAEDSCSGRYMLISGGKVYQASIREERGSPAVESPQLLEFVDPANVRGSNFGTAIGQGYPAVYKVKGQNGDTPGDLLSWAIEHVREARW